MKRTLSYTITNKNKADTIGAFLRDAGYSRRILIELKQNPEQICLNGTPSWLNTPLQIGDTLTLFLPDEPVSSDILPVNLPIDIVYEDEDLIILNKAAGMPVHPSQGHHENTLANALAYRFASRGEHFVFRAVNRLDRDTTGLLLIAKHKISGAFLSAMTAKKEIRREYLAIVAGKPEKSGTIDLPPEKMVPPSNAASIWNMGNTPSPITGVSITGTISAAPSSGFAWKRGAPTRSGST
jgi:23S rRNA pseudouridine1911/1915/1917 synthase